MEQDEAILAAKPTWGGDLQSLVITDHRCPPGRGDMAGHWSRDLEPGSTQSEARVN